MNTQWFSDNYPNTNPAPIDDASQLTAPSTDHSASRISCYEPFERRLPAPHGIKPPTDRMFSRGGMTSSVALVDHVPDGALWFDGFNRVVLNNKHEIIEQHSRGNSALIKAATNDFTTRHIEGRVFFVGNRGYNNFYHWMLDILPSLHLCEKAGFKLHDQDHVVVLNGSSSFQRATLEHLGFQPEQIIQMNRFSPYISADELIVPHYSNGMAMTMGDWVPRYLQSRFLSGECQSPVNKKHLYLARAKDARNGRSIGNEAQMIEFLENRGYLAVYPENYSITEQAALFAQAESIIAAHGAGLTNIAFCKPGTKVIELYGEYMETCYWALSEICGLKYINHFCSKEDSQVDFHARSQKDILEFRRQGFSVNLEELDQLLSSI
jgi:capsular polysaccharide biosynthesis protein